MRWVTMKPPKMLTAASVTATKPMILREAEMPGPAAISAPTMMTRRDRVGDAHQRRMQRRRHPPHDVVADEAGEHETVETTTSGWLAASMAQLLLIADQPQPSHVTAGL